MDDRTLRLECLKLALARSGADDPRPWRAIADDFHAWASGDAPPVLPKLAARPKSRRAGD